MKPLRRFLDRIHPMFGEKGRLKRLYPLYEAVDTFLYTPGTVTTGASHVRDGLDLKRMMVMVVIALIPCFFMACWNTGYQANLRIALDGADPASEWRAEAMEGLGLAFDPESFTANFVHGALWFLPIFLVTNIVGGVWEVIFAAFRGHEVNEGFLVTGALFPLTLPPSIPLWQVALGISFAVVIGKEVFGGTGRNFLNPALVGRAFLYFAYPADITGDTIWTAVDGFSGATPLGALAAANVDTGMSIIHANWDWWDAFWGWQQGSLGETSEFACLLGALMLIATGVGSWRIMAGTLIGFLAFSTALWMLGSPGNPMFLMPPHWHLVVGGFMFGLVFMCTDPVSASMTETGKWFYGGLIGVMTVLIRVINPAFPEGIMLAILFGNVFAPLIDYAVVRRIIKRRAARHAA